MCMGDSHKHKKSKDNETTLGIYDILDEGEKVGEDLGGGGVSNFTSETKEFPGN